MKSNDQKIIHAKIKALSFRMLVCMDDERDEIESEIARLRLELRDT